MPVFNRNRHSGSSGGVAAAYTIEQSCRFNDDDSPGLTWTPGSAADSNKIFTFSVWTKSGNFTGYEKNILTAGSSEQFYYGENSDEEPVAQLIAGGTITADRSMRDPSAWNHMVLRMDTTDGTAGDRFRMYQNGVEITAFRVDTNPSLNATFTINASGTEQRIGRRSDSNRYFDGYIAEVIMLDGVSAGPDSFGESDSAGNWVPIDPSSLTFGANGYWLDFAVAPGTSNGAGTDVSGEGNHFSESGLAANDKVTDSPTDDADNDVGNFMTWNPLDNLKSDVSFSNGNLDIHPGAANAQHVGGGNWSFPSGKWYFELTIVAVYSSGYPAVGIMDTSARTSTLPDQYTVGSYVYRPDGTKYIDTTATSSWGDAFIATDVIGVALDMENGAVYMRNEGVWQASGDPTSGGSKTGAMHTWTAGAVDMTLFFEGYNGGTATAMVTLNSGQSAYANAAPTGYTTCCTANIAAPAITDPSKYFQVDTFTGTGSELARTLTDGGGSAVKPDMVWIKDRDSTVQHVLTDSARGATKEINPDTTTVQSTVAQGLKSFDTSGYTLGTDGNYNTSSSPNVAWCWNTQGGAGSSNEDGSINTTTTSVGTTQGMSISTYVGTAGAGATIGHGLGSAPEFIIIKNYTVAFNWSMYHHKNTAAPETNDLTLNENYATVDDVQIFNDTAPTSTVFSVGIAGNTNQSTKPIVAYCWVGVEGYSKFGSYEGNGNADGTFVWCGFKPAWIMCKSIDSTSDWYIYDTNRDGYNVANDYLVSNTTAAEVTATDIDILSNGFKMRITTDPNVAETYVFAAFAESPFGGDGVSQARAR